MNIKNCLTKLLIIGLACVGTTVPMQKNVLTEESSTHDKNLALFKAISDDDEEAVKKALELGADVNARDEDGNYPLHLRVLSGFKQKNDITYILLESGTSVDIRNKSGYSALLLALLMRSALVSPDWTSRLDNVIAILLDNNANPNLFDPITGNRPLHYAAHFGDAELFKKLLYYGADPNVYNGRKETPLMLNLQKRESSNSNYREINTWLLQYGANLEHKDAVGTLPTGLPDDFKVNDRDTLLLRLTDESQIRFPGLAALQFMRSLVKYNFDVPLKVYSHFLQQNKLDILKKNLEPIKLNNASILREEDLVNVTSYKNRLYRMLLTRPFITKNKIESNSFSSLEIKELFKFIKEKAPLLPETGMLARTICNKRFHENLSQKLATELFNDVLLITQTDSNKRKETHENNEHLDKKTKL